MSHQPPYHCVAYSLLVCLGLSKEFHLKMATWAQTLSANSGVTDNRTAPSSTKTRDAQLETSAVNGVTSSASIISPYCLQLISAFASFPDVLQLRRASRQLAHYISSDDLIWEDQLRYFYREMTNVYGNILLRADFACAELHGFQRFAVHHRLYMFDCQRVWNLSEFTSIRDDRTGLFTVPLYTDVQKLVLPSSRRQMVGAALSVEHLPQHRTPIRIFQPSRNTSSGADEDMLQYVLTLSREELNHSHTNPFMNAGLSVRDPCYSSSQLMTMVDTWHGPNLEWRFGVSDKTTSESEAFLTCLSLTLSGAMRRRLHLPNHHRAVRNNGQTSRRRLGNQDAESVENGIPEQNMILSNFRGALLEISESEVSQLCLGLELKYREAIHLFVHGESKYSTLTADRVYPSSWVRYFLLPEVCNENICAFLIVDPLRALILVQELCDWESDIPLHDDWSIR